MTSTAPTAANALSRSTFGNSWLFSWLNGRFNIFTPSSRDVVNSSHISVQSTHAPIATIPTGMVGGKRKTLKKRKTKTSKTLKKSKKH